MRVTQHASLLPFNTFGIDVRCHRLIDVSREEDLPGALALSDGALFVLGGGSNILFTEDFEGTVIKLGIRGIHIEDSDADTALVKCGAGMVWHDLVQWCLDNDLGGIENLSLIPGCVGAAPIQNIGAYGVELKDVFHHLEAFRLSDGAREEMDAHACRFGYRDSLFKGEGKDGYIITQVYLRLSRRDHHIHTAYGAIQQKLKERHIDHPTIQDVSRAVIDIRRSKLPDPATLGNGGSFFKNPVVPMAKAEAIRNAHPNMPSYPVDDDHVKVPAGWLIEQCGWKGYRRGDAGCYARQALVLVNHGHASGRDIVELATDIQRSVLDRFDIHLNPEVSVIGASDLKL